MAWEWDGYLPSPDMYADSGSSEMGCAAILMTQHTHVWVAVRRLGLILSHSRGAESPSELTMGAVSVYWVSTV